MTELSQVFYKNDLQPNIVSLLLSPPSRTEDHYLGFCFGIASAFPSSSFMAFYLASDSEKPLKPQVIAFLNSGSSASPSSEPVKGEGTHD